MGAKSCEFKSRRPDPLSAPGESDERLDPAADAGILEDVAHPLGARRVVRVDDRFGRPLPDRQRGDRDGHVLSGSLLAEVVVERCEVERLARDRRERLVDGPDVNALARVITLREHDVTPLDVVQDEHPRHGGHCYTAARMKSVLVVDDGTELLDLARRALEKAGYAVDTFTAAEPALDILRRGFKPSIVLLDVLLPGMDGFEFLGEVAKHVPDLPVLVMSGVVDLTRLPAGMRVAGRLEKPFTPEQLVAAVNRALTASGGRF